MNHEDLEAICQSLDRSVAGDPWYGSPLEDLLGGVGAAEAVVRPIPGAHSIAEIVHHLTAWMREVAARLEGREPGMPEMGDWPPAGATPPTGADTAAAAWSDALRDLGSAHGDLLRALAAFPAERLSEPVGSHREPSLGTGVTYAAMLFGLAQHNAYHGGQIALLRRAMRKR